MKKTGLKKLEIVSPEKFTTPNKMKIRKVISPLIRKVILLSAHKKVIIEDYPKLDDNQYIFSSTHYFTEDIQVGIGSLDRNAWALIGTTDQLEHNPRMYGGWLNGIIYVDRNNDKSRKDSLKKMEYILNNGGNVLIYPEGGWNTTENLLVQTLFASPYKLCCSTGKKVVPIAIYNERDNDIIYVKAGEPMDLSVYEKKEALTILRDQMATLMYDLIEKYSKPIVRKELTGDIHLKHMEEIKNDYLKAKWTRDVWDEELTVYRDKSITTPEMINKVVDDVDINASNADIYAPILVGRERDKKYDIKVYMKKNWNKK